MSRAVSAVILSGVVLVGCGAAGGLLAPRAGTIETAPTRLVEDLGAPVPSDPFTLTQVRVQGDDLLVSVRLTGGCKHHQFRLDMARTFVAGNPPRARARVAHRAFGDRCTAVIDQQFRFDLAPLRDAVRDAFPTVPERLTLEIDGRHVTYDLSG